MKNVSAMDIESIDLAHEFILNRERTCEYPLGRGTFGIVHVIAGEAQYRFLSGECVKISKAEAQELIEWYKENGESTRAKIQRLEFLDEGRYRIEKSGNTGRLYCRRKSLYVLEWDL